jgi:hypothetical protein
LLAKSAASFLSFFYFAIVVFGATPKDGEQELGVDVIF